MSEGSGFLTMGESGQPAGDVPTLGVGMLGYAFMGKAHTNAFKKLDYIYTPPPARARLVAIAGRNQERVEAAARRYGYEKAVTDWRALVNDPDIQVFDNGAPNNLHAESCIAAANAGKHIICEKPLGRTAAEAKQMWEAARQAGIVHMCAFNYRFVPAIRLARDIIKAGRLGRIYHFRARYLQEWITDPNFPMVWRMDAETAGTGAIGDLGTHIIDIARFLVGEPATISANVATFIPERTTEDGGKSQVTVDDAFAATLTFENGAIGTLEATRFARGRRNHQALEINGEKGSLAFNMERLNELEVFLPEEESYHDAQGFRQVLVTESNQPFVGAWWPSGHIIGWEHTFVHEIRHFFDAVVNKKSVAPEGADFEDGYRASVIADAIVESARTGQRLTISY
ncbi:MAG TPA: Gfo/Idh/MocA family oxidoreductase [Ktedonobacterales bacterium]|nr:Gfo/Idh/MocA family oxidoreductase [Ktedonobacterales bacterium]